MNNPPQLKKGARGKYVAMLQSLLRLPISAKPDGAVFDDATHDAVVQFQNAHQLMTDGIVGPQTWSALGVVTPAILQPQSNGTVTRYSAVIRAKIQPTPRIYYVNGIQTDGTTHAHTAYALSALTQRVVYGVFNATWSKSTIGMGVDLMQCLADWGLGVGSKLVDIRDSFIKGIVERIRKQFDAASNSQTADAIIATFTKVLSAPERLALCTLMYLENRATAALFSQLRAHMYESQIIVAHSQGNLITANALWALTMIDGPDSLAKMQVYSLASPAPAWPAGIRGRLRAYHHDNDLVTKFNPHNWSIIRDKLGYQRAHGEYNPLVKPSETFDPHFVFNFGDKPFAHDIRKRLSLPDIDGWVFPK